MYGDLSEQCLAVKFGTHVDERTKVACDEWKSFQSLFFFGLEIALGSHFVLVFPVEGHTYNYLSYWIREKTSRPGSFLRPLRKVSSTAKAAPSTTPPSCWTSFTVAAAVPPVARRSSQMITRSPRCTASSWISRVSVPYSRA